MGRRIRIPALVDLLIVDSPGEIRAIADDRALVRGAPLYGPLLNRLIQRNVRRALRTPACPLPSALPREDAERQTAQRRLADALAPERIPWNDASLRALGDYLRGSRERALGPLCQEAVGRLFVPDFCATRATWKSAELVDAAARTLNPLRRLRWRLTSAVERAQMTLARSVEGDAQAVHAIGIAVHSFRRSVERLERALGDPRSRRTLTTEAILHGALSAPDTVLRRANRYTDTDAGAVSAGTLVLMRTGSATALAGDHRVAFLSESWSFCPAHRAVPAMLAEIWRHATDESPPS